MRLRHAALVLAATGALLTSTAPLGTAAPDDATAAHHPGGPKPTVVLVHGAFADASGWNGVIAQLQRAGYPVIAPAGPLRGLAADSAYIASVVKSVTGPVVLVGHSYGGAVISSAAVGLPQVKALVYIAAFVPDAGEKLGDLAAKYPGSDLLTALKPVPFDDANGPAGVDLYIDPAQFRKVFAADVPGKDAAVMAAAQRPVSANTFGDAPTAAAWRTVPSWALVAKQDRAIPPALERFEAQRAGSRTVEIDSSHVAMITHPDVVTRLITSAAHATVK
ncbi:alpha/beta hydrolase [Actinokineospora sp. NBRC 105648]|uniref:alpha/beta fold hydrolase n=1 Tax=Actinokineospora sp. NBRC 105648 TaxID=3032206 RepID=UPI0024A27BD5|nr:alpha/beta hydrolase [Actinokineospora sp. NBRC 105648]GLZ43458.1 alpha/beta hydrolase [Actinokineospora sp. NBRC 105648]